MGSGRHRRDAVEWVADVALRGGMGAQAGMRARLGRGRRAGAEWGGSGKCASPFLPCQSPPHLTSYTPRPTRPLPHPRPSSARAQVWVGAGDIVMVSLRDYQDDKGDVILKYTADEARQLKAAGECGGRGRGVAGWWRGAGSACVVSSCLPGLHSFAGNATPAALTATTTPTHTPFCPTPQVSCPSRRSSTTPRVTTTRATLTLTRTRTRTTGRWTWTPSKLWEGGQRGQRHPPQVLLNATGC